MSQLDFVFDNIYKGALKAGASDRQAREQAMMGVDDWRKNKFHGRVSELIQSRIKTAKKLSK